MEIVSSTKTFKPLSDALKHFLELLKIESGSCLEKSTLLLFERVKIRIVRYTERVAVRRKPMISQIAICSYVTLALKARTDSCHISSIMLIVIGILLLSL